MLIILETHFKVLNDNVEQLVQILEIEKEVEFNKIFLDVNFIYNGIIYEAYKKAYDLNKEDFVIRAHAVEYCKSYVEAETKYKKLRDLELGV